MKSETKMYLEVALLITGSISQYAFKEGENYFFHDGKTVKSISAFQHAMFCMEAAAATEPEKKAVRAISAGQDDDRNFQEALHSNIFWRSTKSEGRDKAFKIEEGLSQKKLTDVLPFLDLAEKEVLIFHLLNKKENSLAFDIVKKEKIDPNLKNLRGVPLFSIAMENKLFEMMEYLFVEGADLNIVNPTNNCSILHQAVFQGEERFIDLLLQDPELNLEIKNNFEMTPVAYAAGKHPKIFEKLHKKGALLDQQNSQGGTPLGLFASLGITERVLPLLEAKADPNAGNPSAFVQALRGNDKGIIIKMMESGGKGFEKDAGGNIPFIEAILRCPVEIVKLMLERSDAHIGVIDNNGINPALATLFSGDVEKINLLRELGAPFPKSMKNIKSDWFVGLLTRYQTLGNGEFIKEMVRWNRGKSVEFDTLIGLFCLNNSINLLDEMIEEGILKPNLQSNAGPTFFTAISMDASENPKYSDFIQTCLDQGGDPNIQISYWSSPFEIAIEKGNIPVIKMLLNRGADLTKTKDPDQSFSKIVKLNDLELVKLAVEHGGNIEGTSYYLPLEIAAKELKPDSDGKVFKWLLEQGANLNAVGFGARTPFSEVILSGNIALVEYCATHGAELNLKSKKTQSPLSWASFKNNDPEGKVFKKLVELGADMNEGDFSGGTSFAVLANRGDLPLVEWALKNGAQVNPKNPSYSYTPLQAAATHKDDPQGVIFKRLIQAGGDINSSGKNTVTGPFVSIISGGNLDLIQWCLDNGADPKRKITGELTPLQAAAALADPTAFKLLIDKGANINEAPIKDLPIFSFIDKGDFELVSYCFEKGAKLTTPELQEDALLAAIGTGNLQIINLMRGKGYTLSPLLLNGDVILKAYKAGKEPLIKLLLDLKVDFNHLDKNDKERLFDEILESNDIDSLQLLLENNVSPIIPHYSGHPINVVLNNAAIKGSVEVLKLLEKHQYFLDMNTLNEFLLRGIIKSKIDMLKYLIEKGFDIKKEIGGESPLRIAMISMMHKPDKNMIEFLLAAGVNAKEVFFPGKPAIYAAVETGDPEIVRLFIEAGAKSEIYRKNSSTLKNAIQRAVELKNQEIIDLLKS